MSTLSTGSLFVEKSVLLLLTYILSSWLEALKLVEAEANPSQFCVRRLEEYKEIITEPWK